MVKKSTETTGKKASQRENMDRGRMLRRRFRPKTRRLRKLAPPHYLIKAKVKYWENFARRLNRTQQH